MVIDGNAKNNRSVCFAKDAGYIQYDGLPGRIKTGCMSTPTYRSHFCDEHKLRVIMDPECNSEDINAYACGPGKGRALVAEKILDKKVTRSTNYYQVHV